MNSIKVFASVFAAFVFVMPVCSVENTENAKSASNVSAPKTTTAVKQGSAVKTEAPVKKTEPAAAKAPAPKSDSIVVIARVLEIPGKFAPNDLYNYLYVMKYRVLQVVSGNITAKEICIGHYNPLIPRAQLKDKMAAVVKGNVEKFEVGGKHRLVLAQPIEKYWNDAKEDEFIDIDDADKYFALKTDVAQ